MLVKTGVSVEKKNVSNRETSPFGRFFKGLELQIQSFPTKIHPSESWTMSTKGEKFLEGTVNGVGSN